MVSAENRVGLYVTIPIYFCLLAGATYWAYKRMETMAANGTADKLSAHYIGGRAFGPLIITGTLFASFFSGYTVVGIPNEAFRVGWFSIRWVPTMAGVSWGLLGTGFRLRKVSQFRNHQSPADFITDRFQSQCLRYTVVFLQILTALIYLAAQVIALKKTFNSIFELDPNAVYPVIIIMLLILIFECIGGLNSVAFTDSIQGIIMVFSFIAIPILIAVNYGSWSTLDPETYPQPTFYQTPTGDEQWKWWQFVLVNFSFFTLPHFVQRIYAVKDLQSLRIGYAVLSLCPWVTAFVGIFMGTMGVTMLANEDGTPSNPDDPFTAIMEKLIDVGGFSEVVACVAITASLAAVMSTADSLIIAISQLVTVEIVYPLLPNATPATMSWYGRGVSLCSVALSLVVGLAWNEGITDLGKIQFPLTMQTVGPFLIGLFANKMLDCHPWTITVAVWSSSFYVVGIYFGYLRTGAHESPLAIDSGITGICIQVFLIVIMETARRMLPAKNAGDDKTPDKERLLHPNRPAWDVPTMSRFGTSSLSPDLVWKSMDGFYEPMTSLYWNALMFFTLSLTTPLVAPSEPPFAEDGSFLYAPYVIQGLPWWASKAIILSIIPFIVLLVGVFKVPRDFPMLDEYEVGKKGVDVDTVDLTPKEYGRRSSYDEPNVGIRQRRSTISTTMQELGIQQEKAPGEADMSQFKRLSTLVYHDLDIVDEAADDEPAKDQVVDA